LDVVNFAAAEAAATKILDIVLVAAFAATKSSTTGPRAKREARIV